jgi:hypothetical protein
MKTSNKLLLGLLALIVLGMIIGNIYLKNQVKNNTEIETKIESNSQTDTISTDSATVHINLK